jgi:DnaK suppressor protein
MQEARMDERMRTDEPETGELTVLKDVDVLTAEERQELAALLHERRRSDVAEAQRMAESLGGLLASRSESTADDEHDPEGPTLSSEWSRLQALRSDAAHDIVAVEAALERMARGTYGVCTRCGEAIGVDRLRARPTAEFCIRCAVAVES